MNKKNFIVGMGLGLIVGSTAAMAMHARHHCPGLCWAAR